MELIIDFEFVDRTLEDLGNGWVFNTVQVIGAAVIVNGGKSEWITGKKEILELAQKADTIVCHNLQCDVGILYSWGLDLSDKLLIDTILLAKLFYNTLPYYNLDYLGKLFYGKNKDTDVLGRVVIEHDLYPTKLDPDKKGNIGKANTFAYKNMDKVYAADPEAMIKYAKTDIELTYMLYEGLNKKWMQPQVEKLSKLFKILIKNRKKGIKLSLENLEKARTALMMKEKAQLELIRAEVNDDNFDPDKPAHIKEVYVSRGYNLPTTDKGNPSVTSPWLAQQTDELSLAIHKYRKYQKARRDYCDKVLESQDLMPEEFKGRIYPSYNIFGARTGRFSSESPNIQQLVGRDQELCDLIRDIYVPEDGESWYTLDFSQQEFRIFAHLANKLIGKARLSNIFNRKPRADFYSITAKDMGIDRDQAKPIALGRLYGMTYKKLAQQMNISHAKARMFLGLYDDKLPEAKAIGKFLQGQLDHYKYVETVGGRRLRTGEPDYYAKCYKDLIDTSSKYAYRAVNYIIQGSAADQIIDTWIALDEAGIDVLCSVHDEMNFSLKSDELARKAQEIMCSAFPLLVPMISDIGKGESWAHARRDAKEKSKRLKEENIE